MPFILLCCFGMEEKYWNFKGSKFYRKKSYEAFWNKRIFLNNSFEVPMDCTDVKEFWRKLNMSSILIVSFPVLFLLLPKTSKTL